MVSPNLRIPEIGTTAQKAPPMNAAVDLLDDAMNAPQVIDVTTGDVELTTTQHREFFRWKFIGSPGGGVLVTIDQYPRFFGVTNECGQILTFEGTAGTSGTTATVASGARALLYSDGENVEVMGAP